MNDHISIAPPSRSRRGDWFQVFSGRRFFALDPDPIDIDIVDIAHALSLICRYNGHCREAYSVAQHSVLVSERVPEECAFEGLLHDASEAYLGDMVRPLKLGMPEYRRAEEHLEKIIAMKYGLRFPWPEPVKIADNRMLATERRDILPVFREDWPNYGEPYPEPVVPWSAPVAEARFLLRFHDLSAQRRAG